VVSLTTDFGWGSPYVAAMKAAVLEACPGAVLVDVSHDVPAFDVVAGAFVLWAGSRHFHLDEFEDLRPSGVCEFDGAGHDASVKSG